MSTAVRAELAVKTEVEYGVEIALGKDWVPVTGAVGVTVVVVVLVVGEVVVDDSEVTAGLACVVVFVSSA